MNITYHFLPETDSTNRWLREAAAPADAEEATVCWTDYQTAGRGCGTNTWESERGKNLLFSVLVHPAFLDAGQQFVLSMMMANAIRTELATMVPTEVSVKWPNDIYAGDKKICGILIESRLQGHRMVDTVLGVGLNVNQMRFVSDAPNPVSLAQLMGREAERQPLLESIVEVFCADVERLRADGRHVEAIHADYLAHLYRRTGRHRFSDERGVFEAELLTVEPDGHLVVRDAVGTTRRYAFKEISFIL